MAFYNTPTTITPVTDTNLRISQIVGDPNLGWNTKSKIILEIQAGNQDTNQNLINWFNSGNASSPGATALGATAQGKLNLLNTLPVDVKDQVKNEIMAGNPDSVGNLVDWFGSGNAPSSATERLAWTPAVIETDIPASGVGVLPPSIDPVAPAISTDPIQPQRGTAGGSTEPSSSRTAEFRDANNNGIDDRDEVVGGGSVRTAEFRDANNNGIDDRDEVVGGGSYIRNDKDSGFAYPWSAAKATGTTDVMGTIGKAVDFMNKHEGKNYKYDSVKGTIQAEDGSFINKSDVQSLNNIITKYNKSDFKPAGGGTSSTTQPVNLTYGGAGTPSQHTTLSDVTNGAVKIDSAPQDGLYTTGSGGFAGGSTGVKTHPVEGFNLP